MSEKDTRPATEGEEDKRNPHDVDGKDEGRRSRDRASSKDRRRKRSRSRDRGRTRRGARGRSRDRTQGRGRGRSRSPSNDPRICRSEEDARMRDAKCVFVTQLQIKAREDDVAFYFGLFCKVIEVALIKEKASGRSKGCGYVELATMEDVNKALLLNGLPFVWRDGTKGFPLVVRPSEAHRMYVERGTVSVPLTGSNSGVPLQNITLIEDLGPGSARARIDGGPIVVLPTHRGKPMNTRILYVGNLHKTLTEKDLREIFGSFGGVETVTLKTDPNTGASKGFAFVKFTETAAAANANERLNGYELLGLTLTCNPVNDKTITSAEDNRGRGGGDDWSYLDDDSRDRSKGVSMAADRRALLMSKLAGGAAQDLISAVPVPVQHNAGPATRALLIKNMFDPATETAPDWDKEIEKDTFEECSRFGRVTRCVVDTRDPNGKVTVQFEHVEDAKKCAASLQGRFFAQRQIVVDFI